ncbi:DUF523 domain-containing protein [Lachnospiraceae bacterium LCP25S3_G4]
MNILVSACLLGVQCRYKGDGQYLPALEKWKEEHHLIPICPEIYGGMPTPREPAEQRDGKVITRTGEDVTEYFQRGAQEVLKLAKFYQCEMAILKERSPSCGYQKVYDGTFSSTLVDGNGVLAELLEKEGITIIGESQV